MFASKHQAGAPPELAEAGERPSPPRSPPSPTARPPAPSSPAIPSASRSSAFAALQGLVALANNGMLGDDPLDDLLEDALQRLLLGLRPR